MGDILNKIPLPTKGSRRTIWEIGNTNRNWHLKSSDKGLFIRVKELKSPIVFVRSCLFVCFFLEESALLTWNSLFQGGKKDDLINGFIR